MEQLVIFLLFVVASIVSGIIQKKKKADEEAAQRELEQSVGPRTAQTPASQPTAQPPVTRWPRSALDWKEQLRKMVEENAPPVIKPITKPAAKPVVIKPVIVSQQRSSKPAPTPPIVAKILPPIEKSEGDLEFKSPLRESASAYERASSLQTKVEERLRAIDQQTSTHRPTPATRSTRHTNQIIRKLRKRPSALREAFVASLIFSPPKSLED